MNPQEQKHYFLQIFYYASFVLAFVGGITTFILSLYAIKLSVTQSLEELQWGTQLAPIFLLGILSFVLGGLNFKLESTLKQLGAQGAFIRSSKRILNFLAVLIAVSVGVCFAVSLFRVEFLKK